MVASSSLSFIHFRGVIDSWSTRQRYNIPLGYEDISRMYFHSVIVFPLFVWDDDKTRITYLRMGPNSFVPPWTDLTLAHSASLIYATERRSMSSGSKIVDEPHCRYHTLFRLQTIQKFSLLVERANLQRYLATIP